MSVPRIAGDGFFDFRRKGQDIVLPLRYRMIREMAEREQPQGAGGNRIKREGTRPAGPAQTEKERQDRERRSILRGESARQSGSARTAVRACKRQKGQTIRSAT
ncbi:MAG TPA: hypothetical protein DCY37_00970 [Acidaminococcaceae bacterium]|nr:hypothetical protein [Acidaminococcaceae bacterium]